MTLAARPAAQTGTFTLSVEDTRDGSVSTELTIRAGVSLLVATPATALPAGATSTLRLDATLQSGVTDPGPITFPMQVDGVYVNGYPRDCHSTGEAVECPGPRIDGLLLFVSRNQPAGPLPLQARFAGGQRMAITDSAGHPLQVGAPVPPPHLVLSELQPGQPTIAGGTGTATLTATNDGGEASQPAPITVTTPPGVTVARIDLAAINLGIDPAAASCTPSDRVPCQLPTITAGQSLQLSIALTAEPQAKEGSLTVSAGGATASLKPLVVHSGMTSIVSTPGGPFTQGSTTPLTLTAQTTVATPGAITLTLGRGDVSFGRAPEGCTRRTDHGDDHSDYDQSDDDHETRRITCAGPVIAGLPLILGEHQPAGSLPLTATDAGGRDVPVTDQSGHRLTAARTPARLEPAITQVSDPLTAGASGGVTLTVHNAGGTASEAATLGATLPTGIDVASYRIGGTTCTPGHPTTCSVPPVAPGSTTTVAVTLLVGAQAKASELTFTVGGQSVRTTVRVLIADTPAALDWQVTDVSAPLRAGGSASATVAIINTGGQPSEPRTVLLTPPAGIGIGAITAGDGALCSPAGQTCTLPPIAPGATTTVTAALTAAPDAHSGSLVLTSGDQRLDVPLTVDGGVRAVTANRQDTLVPGSTARLQVAVAAYPGVTDLGGYLLALHTDQAWFSGYPANCQLLAGHPTELTCTGAAVAGLQLTLSGDQHAGSLPLFAVDAGGRSMPVTDANGAPLMVVDPTAATARTPADGAVVTPQSSAQPPPATASKPPESPPVAPTSGDEPSGAPPSGDEPSTAPTPAAEPAKPAAPAGLPGSAEPSSTAGTARTTASGAAR
ncbi:MAG TPA: hypothetical protein VES60_12955 [Nakamurella sp.]|nr:hypothetical protein [Nakamurella sp.]